MKLIERIAALEVLDSRGNPTVLARVYLDDGTFGQAGQVFGAHHRHAVVEVAGGQPFSGQPGRANGPQHL